MPNRKKAPAGESARGGTAVRSRHKSTSSGAGRIPVLQRFANYVYGVTRQKVYTPGGGASLSSTEIRVGFLIAKHVNRETGDAWPGAATIANQACLSRTAVERSIQRLRGFFHVEEGGTTPGGQRVSNRYRPKANPEPPPSPKTRPTIPTGEGGPIPTGEGGQTDDHPLQRRGTIRSRAGGPSPPAPHTIPRGEGVTKEELKSELKSELQRALPRSKESGGGVLPSGTSTDASKRTSTERTNEPPLPQQGTLAVEETYLLAFNAAHGTTHAMTPNLKASVRACLKADPPYKPDAIIAAAIMSVTDDWYSDKTPAYPLRFGTESKSHLDDLLAKIVPGAKFGKVIVDLVKAHGVLDYFRERTRSAQALKQVAQEAGA